MKNNSLPSTQGVYRITNIVNSKFYIGSTNNLKRRYHCHRCSLKGNYHTNEYLQNSFNKYGEESFIFEILECVDESKSLDEVRDVEQLYLDKVEDWDLCFNARKTANYCNPSPLTEETKLRMSEARKGDKNPNYGKERPQELKELLHKTYRVSGSGIIKKPCGTYEVRINNIGENIYLGCYKTKEEGLEIRLLAEEYYWHKNEFLAEFFIELTKKKELPVGVQYIDRLNKFAAQIKVGKKTLHLGTFKTPEEALERRLLGEGYYWKNDKSLEALFVKPTPKLPKGIGQNGKRFSPYIQENKKRKYLGCYETVELALQARENYIKSSSQN
jgi:group I intron endonuclease